MEFTVFYAWQSDRSEKGNRYLIRDAVKEALKQIGKDASIQESPRLDHDTKGVSGMPDIVGTIFKKIESCGVFLADLTFVGETQEGKRLPNPNVVLELGYAARCIGWERVICVVNEAYGPAKELIFDIRHRRWPIVYELKSDSLSEAQKATKKNLISQIKEAVLGLVNSEYSAVEDAIAGLTMDCIRLLNTFKNMNEFSFLSSDHIETQLMFSQSGPLHVPIPSKEWKNHAINRLLDLKIIMLDHFDHDHIKYSHFYRCTYFGKLVIKKLGIIE